MAIHYTCRLVIMQLNRLDIPFPTRDIMRPANNVVGFRGEGGGVISGGERGGETAHKSETGHTERKGHEGTRERIGMDLMNRRSFSTLSSGRLNG